MFNIANDIVYMENSLADIVQVDDFTRNLLNINKQVQQEGLAQPIISCIDRSDYLLNWHNDKQEINIRQVEINAIASGMSSHSNNVEFLHKYLMNKYRIKPLTGVTTKPINESLDIVAKGMIDAFDAYNKQDCFILLVAEDKSFNFSDHFLIELAIHKYRPDIRLVRKKFQDLDESINLKLGPNKELLIDNDHKEIALVYFRYCYDPSNYRSLKDWNVRLTLERSRAIKCPSINFHISGAKKFQQTLNNQQELERFLTTKDAERLMKVYCKIWPIDADSSIGQEGYNMGLTHPNNLVLKPQREGGGHNIFGQDIKPFLEGLKDKDKRAQYILMEHINSPSEKNWLLLHDDDDEDSTKLNNHNQLISELGIFGAILGENNSHIRSNKSGGYLIRSKKFGVNEGGVASGYAGLSSLMLYDDTRDDLNPLLYYDH